MPAPPGEANGAAKLTEEKVRAIRRRRDAGAKLHQIKTEFGISIARASLIVRRKAWAHVD